MDTGTKSEKRFGNKITDERTSAGKSKNTGKEEDNKVNKMQEIEIPLEKRLQIIDDLRLY